MKRYRLKEASLGIEAGQIFLESDDGSYKNSTNDISLPSSIVEKSPKHFEKMSDLYFWKPEVVNQSFWMITPDLSPIELGWNEERFSRLWRIGGVFENRENAFEVSQAIAALLPTYQAKFNAILEKSPKPVKMLNQTVSSNNAPPLPVNNPVIPPIQSPPVPQEVRYSPFDKFILPNSQN